MRGNSAYRYSDRLVTNARSGGPTRAVTGVNPLSASQFNSPLATAFANMTFTLEDTPLGRSQR
jgi:hypothetical protein